MKFVPNIKKGLQCSKLTSSVKKCGNWFHKNYNILLLAVIMLLTTSNVAFAGDGEDAWNLVIGQITTWVTRLGVLVIVVGGIMFGLGFKNDDAEAKTRGISTMVAGGIVCAVIVAAKAILQA